MAPEMSAMTKPKTYRVDVWSYAVVIVDLFGEVRVFQDLHEFEIMGQVCDSFENKPRGPTTKTSQKEGVKALCRACFEQDAKTCLLWLTFSALARQATRPSSQKFLPRRSKVPASAM